MSGAKPENPFKLPAGNVAIAFSGGRTSGMMLHHILEANGELPDRAIVTFQNTGREMPETLDFVQECGERWGVPITWLEYRDGDPKWEVVSHNSASRNGEPFEAMIRKKKGLPYKFARFCTSELKVHCQTRYIRATFGWDQWMVATGMRADEPRRVNKNNSARERWDQWFPLFDAGETKASITKFWAGQPFNLRLPNVKGRTQLGNCDGCFLKSEASRAALAREFPERFKWWADMEALCTKNGWGGRNQTFLADQGYADLGRFIERQGDWIFNTEGALCQADDGECFL
jgi:3'-phosphoadenosine 5'-phosphosulfate sulfotransferase (PAPS reductase)/FAD synthetase